MNLNLDGRLALVTGSSSGLGLEIAKVLAKSGATVIICGRNIKKLDDAYQYIWSIRKNPPPVIYRFFTDGRDAESVRKMFEDKIRPKTCDLDILVNNIGRAQKFGRFEDLTDEDWLNTFDLNVMTTIRFTREALPLLKKSSHGGRIINISSFVGLKPGRFNFDYAVCKAGIINFTECIARNYGQYGIRANVICPNTLMGDGLERNAADRATREGISVEEAKNKIIESAKKKNPLGKVGELADVANLVAFLCSDEANFINGCAIPVDGGGLKGT